MMLKNTFCTIMSCACVAGAMASDEVVKFNGDRKSVV